jgi:hypothetical protein
VQEYEWRSFFWATGYNIGSPELIRDFDLFPWNRPRVHGRLVGSQVGCFTFFGLVVHLYSSLFFDESLYYDGLWGGLGDFCKDRDNGIFNIYISFLAP